MRAFKIAVWTVVASTIGFGIGWWIEFGRLMGVHRPNGCDAPCILIAGEFYDDALWGGPLGALVVGLPTFVLAWRHFAKPS